MKLKEYTIETWISNRANHPDINFGPLWDKENVTCPYCKGLSNDAFTSTTGVKGKQQDPAITAWVCDHCSKQFPVIIPKGTRTHQNHGAKSQALQLVGSEDRRCELIRQLITGELEGQSTRLVDHLK